MDVDWIITILRRDGDLTPAELLETLQAEYNISTLAFAQGIAQLEAVGLVWRENIRNKDSSGSTVFIVDRARTDAQRNRKEKP